MEILFLENSFTNCCFIFLFLMTLYYWIKTSFFSKAFESKNLKQQLLMNPLSGLGVQSPLPFGKASSTPLHAVGVQPDQKMHFLKQSTTVPHPLALPVGKSTNIQLNLSNLQNKSICIRRNVGTGVPIKKVSVYPLHGVAVQPDQKMHFLKQSTTVPNQKFLSTSATLDLHLTRQVPSVEIPPPSSSPGLWSNLFVSKNSQIFKKSWWLVPEGWHRRNIVPIETKGVADALAKAKGKNKIGFYGMILSNTNLTILLLIRWVSSGHVPLSNLYESLLFLTWSITLIQLILASGLTAVGQKQKTNELDFLGVLLCPLALLIYTFASFSLPAEMHNIKPLVPALQSNWLLMHVSVMILSYGTLLCGCIFSITFLLLSTFLPFGPCQSNSVDFGSNRNSVLTMPALGPFGSRLAEQVGNEVSTAMHAKEQKPVNIWSRNVRTSTWSKGALGLVKLKSESRDALSCAPKATQLLWQKPKGKSFVRSEPLDEKSIFDPLDIGTRIVGTVPARTLLSTRLTSPTSSSGVGAMLPLPFGKASSTPLHAVAVQPDQKMHFLKQSTTVPTIVDSPIKTSAWYDNSTNMPQPQDLFQTNHKDRVDSTYNIWQIKLDNLSYRMIGIGFAFLTIGILSGAVWANETWGSYWSWDPKETWAFITWLIFAIYLHSRLSYGWQGKKPAKIATIGFLVLWICYLGVNLLGKGLHSYGWVSS